MFTSTPFPHLSETIQELKRNNFLISIDSLNTDDLLVGAKAGADFYLVFKKNLSAMEKLMHSCNNP